MNYKQNQHFDLKAPHPAPLDHPLVENLKHKLSLTTPLTKIPAMPMPGADPADCFGNVNKAVREIGGAIRYGWAIWLFPTVLIEAEFHAIWIDPQGNDVDITPRGFSETSFISDPSRIYQGYQTDNFRIPLSQYPPIVEYIELTEKFFAVMNSGPRKLQHGEIRLKGAEAELIQNIRLRMQELLLLVADRNRHHGPNLPCLCGSNLKFKKCCAKQ